MERIIENLKNIQAIELENGFANGELYNDCEDKINAIRLNGSLKEVETVQGDTYGGMTKEERIKFNKN